MRRLGLFPKLSLGLMFVVAVAFAVNTWLTIRAGQGPLQRLVAESLSLQARMMLDEVEQYLVDCGDEIHLWSRLPVMDELLIGDRSLTIENHLIELQREDPGRFAILEVTDSDGVIVASTDVSRIGTSRDTSDLGVVVTETGGFWMGPFPDIAASSEPTLVLGHPIRSRLRPEPIGWFIGEASWNRVAGIVGTAGLAGRPQDETGFLALFDGSGRLLCGQPTLLDAVPGIETLAMAIGDDVETRRLGDGGTYMMARDERAIGSVDPNARLRAVGVWRAVEAGRAVSGFVRAVIKSAVLGLVLAGGASFVIARNLTRRIRDLNIGTKRVAEGDLGYRVRAATGDELEDLARSFNRMGERLVDAREDRIRLEREILEISENERKRMGQDLHDGVGQALTGTALMAKGLETRLRHREADEADQAGTICGLINDAIGQTRSVARGLFPIVLEDEGLAGALDDLASSVEAVSPVTCSFNSHGGPIRVPARLTALYLYRIAQEAVNNALRHAQPSTIEITLDRHTDTALLTIRDDGSGLPERHAHGMGLRLMSYRAAVIGAALEFRGAPGTGTEVVCRFTPAPVEA